MSGGKFPPFWSKQRNNFKAPALEGHGQFVACPDLERTPGQKRPADVIGNAVHMQR
jgi:hypothetical protein